jgi:hypothetical protein
MTKTSTKGKEIKEYVEKLVYTVGTFAFFYIFFLSMGGAGKFFAGWLAGVCGTYFVYSIIYHWSDPND